MAEEKARPDQNPHAASVALKMFLWQSDDSVCSSGLNYREDRFVQFTEHEACWRLDRRGVVGETVLHLCYHNDTPIHTEIAKTLLHLYPKMALDFKESEEYYGEWLLLLTIISIVSDYYFSLLYLRWVITTSHYYFYGEWLLLQWR